MIPVSYLVFAAYRMQESILYCIGFACYPFDPYNACMAFSHVTLQRRQNHCILSYSPIRLERGCSKNHVPPHASTSPRRRTHLGRIWLMQIHGWNQVKISYIGSPKDDSRFVSFNNGKVEVPWHHSVGKGYVTLVSITFWQQQTPAWREAIDLYPRAANCCPQGPKVAQAAWEDQVDVKPKCRMPHRLKPTQDKWIGNHLLDCIHECILITMHFLRSIINLLNPML